MNSKYLKALRLCEDKLIDDIIVTDIIPDMRTCSSFTREDEEYIYHEITSKAKVTKLLDIIREKDDECFEKFFDILSTTNEELAEILDNEINDNGNNTRRRRFSVTECGEILIKGGVPIRSADYVPRPVLEKQILNCIKSNLKKPIYIHGIVGSGKSSIISNLLHNQEIFPDKFISCCWLTIGNINETEVVNKLKILLKKLNLNKSSDISMSNIPEIIVEDIKKQLFDTTTLLILQDVNSPELMKYFTFNQKYIVISHKSNLFSPGTAQVVQIPEKFTVEECEQFLNYHVIDNFTAQKIIKKSDKHPMYLSWICNLVKSNEDTIRLIDQLDFDEPAILRQCIELLDENVRKYLIMLIILRSDESLTLELLSIYWDVTSQEALKLINNLCDNNFMKKEWHPEYNCNMYGVYNLYLNYLKLSSEKVNIQDYEKKLVQRFFQKFKTWLVLDIPDPFFFIFYGNMLYNSNDFETLTNLYCNYSFIAAKIAVCGISELVYDYEKYRSTNSDDKWNEFENFLRKYSHMFHKLSDIRSTSLKISKVFATLIQCGLYEMKNSIIYKLAFENRNLSKRKDFWDWVNPTMSIKIWENNYGDRIELVDINDYCLLISTADSRVMLIELNSGTCFFTCQISKNPIILVKFIRDMEVLVIDSNAQFWLFNPNELDSEIRNLRIFEDEEEYDDDVDSSNSEEINSNRFLAFRKYFQNLSVEDKFKSPNIIDSPKLKNGSLQAQFICEEIYFFNNIDQNTYVGIYDLKKRLKNDYTIPNSTKKYLFSSDGSIFYSLQYDGNIMTYNECGESSPHQIIPNETIVDFIVNETDIFCVARNKVYKNIQELFSVEKQLSISNISMSSDAKFLVLCLSDDTVQIWDHAKRELIYSLCDSKFNNVYFPRNSNNLITTGETNVAKWNIKDLKERYNNNNDNNNNENNDSLFISYYHRQFIMKSLKSSVILVLQTIKNHIEFCTYDNEIFTTKSIIQNCVATCFSYLNDFVFIGFKSGVFEIYNLWTFEKKCEMKSSEYEIVSLATYKIDDQNIGVVVYCSKNGIKVYNFNHNELEIVNLPIELPKNVQRCKFFNLNENMLMCGIYNYKSFTLYKISGNEVSTIGVYYLDNGIIDADISVDIQFLCLISTNSFLKIWDINSPNHLIADKKKKHRILRKCKFRPKYDFNKWRLVAVINDYAEIYLYYFSGQNLQINSIVEESSTVKQIPHILEWSSDSTYLFVGDYDIKNWKIPIEPKDKDQVKLPLIKVQTYFGGIQCVQIQDNFISTVDQQGFLYVLKKLK